MSDAAAAHEHENHDAVYWAKFWWLLGLTLAEVGVAVALHGKEGVGVMKLFGLGILACWKAGIVLQHYMHLKQEGKALKVLLLFPMFLISVLVLGVTTDGYFLHYAMGN